MPPIGGGRSGLALVRREPARRRARRAGGARRRARAQGPEVACRARRRRPVRALEPLDLLGFEHQVVYSSLCAPLFDDPGSRPTHAAYRAHNRAVASFCAADERLLGVGMCDLDDVDRSLHRARRRARPRAARGLAPGPGPGRPGAGPRRPRPVLGPPGRARGAVRAARRQRCRSDRRRLARRRPPAGRGDDRCRDHRFQGLHGRLPDRPSGSCRCSCSMASSSGTPACTAAPSRWAPAGSRRCCAASTTPSRSGSAPSPASARSSARRPSRPPPSCASRPTRSRTSAGCAPSPTRRCTCSRPTTPTPRAAAIRSAASTARSPPRRRRRPPRSTPATPRPGSRSPARASLR